MRQYGKMNACKIITKDIAKSLLPSRKENSNKGTYGKVLNFSGCKEYIGASYLSSVAPLKAGAGLVELAAPDYVREKTACLCPDIIFYDTESKYYLSKLPKEIDYETYSAIITGCGLGNNEHTKKFMKEFLEFAQNSSIPIIYDADALNIIAETNTTNLGKKAIITPHPGEMARLMQTDIADIQTSREDWAIRACQKYNAVTVLKGHNTVIAAPCGELYVENTATNILSKAGMGDVLAGIIAGYIAQGLSTEHAAVLGTYIHAQAGIIAEKDTTNYGLLASELINYIPEGIKAVIL